MNQHLTEQQLIDYQFKLADEAALDEARSHLEQCEPCRRRLQTLVRKFAALDLLREEIQVPADLLAQTVANAVRPRGIGILPMCRRAIWALQGVVFHGRDARDTHGQEAHATVGKPSQSRPSRVIQLYRVPALGAVAAAVIVGFALLLVSDSGRHKRILPTESYEQPAQKAVSAPSLADSYVFEKDELRSADMDSLRRAELAPRAETGRVGLAPPELASAPAGNVKAESPVRGGPATSGEGVSPLRVAGVPPALRGQDTLDTKSKAGTASPQTPDGVTTSALDVARMAQAREIAEKPPFAPASAIELVVLPRRQDVQLTIYNGADLTLVRERRHLTLKRGWNWLQFMWANTLIDPTSLSLEPLEHRDAVQVQQLVFPPRLRELGRWLIRSEIDGQVPFELTYFTSGLAWRAFYMGTLSQDEKTMRLESYVRVNNHSGEDYENAQTRLVVGRVHLLDQVAELAKRQYAYGSPVPPDVWDVMTHGRVKKEAANRLGSDRDLVSGAFADSVEPKEIRKEGLSEYFLYTIEGTETIPNQWGKRLLSFEADEIPVVSLYKYDEERWGAQAVRFLSFANDEDHKLGATPLPDGAVRIYGRAGEGGHLSYVGAMDVKYIPVGAEIELNLGPARLVEVKPVLMDVRTENHTFDTKGEVSGCDEVQTWKIETANASSLPVDIEVTRRLGTPYWTLKPADAAVTYEKHDATHARFKLTIASHSKRVFEYTVTTYHGVRQGALPNAN
ncbi:MAG: DUF4139 domain-containing protein [Planctomycetes bacterium]|nr:DUF4139 domain-containing protein [Planctomycetota bacterium]